MVHNSEKKVLCVIAEFSEHAWALGFLGVHALFLEVPVKRFGMTKPHSCLKEKIKAFTADESGVAVIEYMVIASLIVSICVIILKTMGEKTRDKFSLIDGLF